MKQFLILTDAELLTPDNDFFYYCLWYNYSLLTHEFNVSKASLNKTAYITHDKVDRFNKDYFSKYNNIIQWQTLRNHLNAYKDKVREEKSGQYLIIIPLTVVDKVMETIAASGIKPQGWSVYFRTWCYFWMVIQTNNGEETKISQPGAAKKLKVNTTTLNEIVLNLMRLNLIERVGNFQYNVKYSHGFSYKIPKSIEVLSENNWKMD